MGFVTAPIRSLGSIELEPLRKRLAAHWRMAALAGFACWVLLVGSHHEPWFDEAQAWLLARDNGLWPLLAERVRYEGTPGLWHAILWFAIRAGLPYSCLFLIPAGFSIAGAAVVLRGPFSAPLKLAVLGSYYFGYQFSVVARSYSVDLVLMPLAAAFFAMRVERPLRYALVIGLIANLNAHGFVAGGVLGTELAWRLWRKRRAFRMESLSAVALAGGLGLAALWTAWQPADNGYLHADMRLGPVASLVMYVANAFIDRITVWSTTPPSVADLLVGFLLSTLLQRPIVRLIMAGSNRLMAAALIGALIFFSVIVYSSPWHSGLLFLFWLFLVWIELEKPIAPALRRNATAVVMVICLLQTIETLRSGIWDVENVYSPGAAAAKALEVYRRQHPRSQVAAFGFKAFEVQPWMRQNPFDNYHSGAPRPSYIVWLAQSWSPRVNQSNWQRALQERPDLILASSIDLGGRRYDLLPPACAAGYGIRRAFPGAMIWRGVAIEDQTLTMFERGRTAGCGG